MKSQRISVKSIKPIIKKYGITSFGIFGSRARGQARPSSDLDVLVKFYSTPSLFTLARIERELSRALRLKVDLSTEQSLSPYLKNNILKEMKLVL